MYVPEAFGNDAFWNKSGGLTCDSDCPCWLSFLLSVDVASSTRGAPFKKFNFESFASWLWLSWFESFEENESINHSFNFFKAMFTAAMKFALKHDCSKEHVDSEFM